VIYSYTSFLGGGCGAPGTPTAEAVFAPFESAHHVRIVVECPQGTLVSTLLSEENAPEADVVVGLDEITGPQAVADGLLAPYEPPSLHDVRSNLSATLGAPGYLTPYEYGYLAIDYNESFWNATSGAVANWSFPELAANSTWAKSLLVEDPLTDITGEEFLLWEIAFYQQVLHEDWTGFWSATDPSLVVAPDWTTAFSDFSGGPGSPPLVVSYSTDSAYSAYYGQEPPVGASVGRWNGTSYGWQTVYGAGIVKGSPHYALDEAFVNWLLNGSVQAQLPLTEWEYPANATVPWPSVFASAVSPSTIVPLDSAISPENRTAELPSFLDRWQEIANNAG
jgi:thiamine transport system substrate-binding protein